MRGFLTGPVSPLINQGESDRLTPKLVLSLHNQELKTRPVEDELKLPSRLPLQQRRKRTFLGEASTMAVPGPAHVLSSPDAVDQASRPFTTAGTSLTCARR